jgi:hypothetical protein
MVSMAVLASAALGWTLCGASQLGSGAGAASGSVADTVQWAVGGVASTAKQGREDKRPATQMRIRATRFMVFSFDISISAS